MSHKCRVILDVDILYQNKIIFENKEVWFYAEPEISKCRCWDEFTVDGWNSDDETYRANRDGYLYATILKEWCSLPDVENFEEYADFTDFTLLVKAENFEDVEVEHDCFEPDWDLMREGK